MMVVTSLLGCIAALLAHAKATSEGESGVGSEPLPLACQNHEDAKQMCLAALNIDTGDLSELAGHPEHSIGEIVIVWLGLGVRARVG